MTRILGLAAAMAFAVTAQATVPADPASPAADVWRFDVFLDDRPIGYHQFEVRQEGATLEVASEARFEVQFLFVTAYRYEHDNRETWTGECLQRIESRTDDNGDAFRVVGDADPDGFDVARNDGDTTLDADCVRSFAYWNPAFLDADRLLNAQTGEFKTVDLRRVGPATVPVNDTPVNGEEYVLATEDGDIRLFYEAGTGRWLGLETAARGERTLRYVARTIPERAPGTLDVARRGDAAAAPQSLPTP